MIHVLLLSVSLSAAGLPNPGVAPLDAGADPAAPEARSRPQVPDTIRLGDLLATVMRADPRSRQMELHAGAADLRLRNLRTEWYPRIALRAETSYQTDVPTVSLGGGGAGGGGGTPPGGSVGVPTPPKDRYEVAAEVEQLVYDGGRIQRREVVERARLAERTAETRSTLYGLREELNAAFFTALLEQERRVQLELLLEDLGARADRVTARVREGAALRSELAALEAERIRARQEIAAAEEARQAALDRLELLMGREIAEDEVLAVPEPSPLSDLGELVVPPPSESPDPAENRGGDQDGDDAPDPDPPPGERLFSERPEWQRMEWTRTRIRTEAALADAEDRPRISLFVRGAYGRPGLDFFRDDFSSYATVGARLQWPALEWGSSERRSEALEIQAEIVETERAALTDALRRRTASALHEIDRLETTLESDEEVVALREEIERTARRQLEEGVLLPSEYVETRTDLFEARLVTRTHRIQLAEAQVRLRTILGRDLSPENLP